MAASVIYKLTTAAEWEEANRAGVYRGSKHDLRDGFIHFSTATQLAETARKYFSSVPDLMLLVVSIDCLVSQHELRWEPARDGDLFPHLYGELPLVAVTSALHVALGPIGEPLLPCPLPG